MEKQEKLAMIEASRGPLEREEFQAELDLEVAQKSGADELIAGPQERLTTVREQISVLDAKKKAVEKEDA